jgi:hypothetical protein
MRVETKDCVALSALAAWRKPRTLATFTKVSRILKFASAKSILFVALTV